MEEPPSILVVEDDLGMREILVETLEEEEYVVVLEKNVSLPLKESNLGN